MTDAPRSLVERLRDKAETIRAWIAENKDHDWFPPGQADKSLAEADLWEDASVALEALEREVAELRQYQEDVARLRAAVKPIIDDLSAKVMQREPCGFAPEIVKAAFNALYCGNE